MKKRTPKYAFWSIDMLEREWDKLSSRREKLANKIGVYEVKMREIKDAIKSKQP